MSGWYHQLNGREFKQALGDGDGQQSLVCSSPWGLKESDTTERLNNNIRERNSVQAKETREGSMQGRAVLTAEGRWPQPQGMDQIGLN